MEPFTVNIESREAGVVVQLIGDASCVQAEFLRDALKPVLETRPQWVVLDLAALQFINSLGLGVLVAFYKNLESQGASLSMAGPSDRIDEVLQTTRLCDLIPTFPDVKQAIASR